MNSSVSWSIKDTEHDPHGAAVETVNRAGAPVGDWLDDIIVERAKPAVPSGSADHRAEMDAIAAQMARFARPAAAADESGDALGADAEPQPPSLRAIDTGTAQGEAPRFEGNDAIRNAVAEIARRQAVLDGYTAAKATPGAVPPSWGPASTEARFAAGHRFVPSRDGLHGSDGAMTPSVPQVSMEGASSPDEAVLPDDSASRHDVAPFAAAQTRGPTDQRRSGTDLGTEVAQTFARFSRDLHDAIHATDARPAVQDLDRQVRQIGRAVAGIGAWLPPGETLARINEQTREMRDLLAAGAGRLPSATFAERQAATLEARLGQSVSLTRSAASDRDGTAAETPMLLDDLEPGAVLALETSLDDLSSRMERGLDAQDRAGLIEGLSRRVDEIQSSLRPHGTGVAADTRPLERLVRGISDHIGQVREASADASQLETAVSAVAAGAEGGVSTIEAQIAKLAERLDRSESSLKVLDGVGHSLGELFSQLEITRQVAVDAAEAAARTAARDTLRAALQNPSLGLRTSDASPGLANQVTRGMDDLRATQESAERRTQAVLSDMQNTMERLARQISDAGGPGIPAGGRAADMPRTGLDDGGRGRGRTQADEERRAQEAGRNEGPPRGADEIAGVDLDPSDLLIEPGFGRGQQGRTEPRFGSDLDGGLDADASTPTSVSGSPAVDGDGPASFIAAARRAAQAAQASAATNATLKAGEGRSASRRTAAPGAGTLGRARDYLARNRRPILLTIAALVLLVGVLEAVKLSLDAQGPARIGTAGSASSETGSTRVAGALPQVGAEPGGKLSQLAPASTQLASQSAQPVAAPPSSGSTATAPGRAPLPTFVVGPAKPQIAAADGIGDGLRSLAAAGDPAAQYEVGVRFADGRGVGRDPKLALTWLEKAGQQGLPMAQYRLGSVYEKGIGADRDPVLALSWYGKAAEAGNVRAMHNLAVMAAEGAAGKPDYAKAAQWFQKASSYGVRDSQFNLAILYARGLGIEQSLAQSYTWFAIAASEGDEDAAKKRDEVGQKLDAAVLTTAKAAVDAYRPAPQTPAANDVSSPPGGWDAVAPRAQGRSPAANGGSAKVSRL